MKRLVLYAADVIPAAIITTGVALSLIPFFVRLPAAVLVVLFLASFVARAIAPVHHHCHAHRRLLGHAIANHVYDTVLMMAAGNITAVWELQHVLGHHPSHLTPERDPAGVSRFTNEGPFQRIIFTIAGDFSSFGDSIGVALRQRHSRRLLAKLFAQQTLQLGVLAALLYWNAAAALTFVIVPQLILRWFVFYFSYGQHRGVPNTDVYSGSVTRFGWTNAVFLNVGHHTAHHEKPTLHWSLLPERTASILERIPKSCVRGLP